jgi:GLPGLI family protein
MKRLIFIYIILTGTNGFSQQLEVTYERRANVVNQTKNIKNEERRKFVANMLSKPVAFRLVVKDGVSFYAAVPEEDTKQVASKEIKIQGAKIKTLEIGKEDGGLYKNYATGEYLKEANLFGKKFLIKDSIQKIDWSLSSETKKLGEYTVYKATATVNDEPVTAWYTEEIPVPDGPESYYGLPGLILEAENDALSFHAITVSFDTKAFEIVKPSKGKEVTIAEYIKTRNEKLEELKSGNGNVLKFGG